MVLKHYLDIESVVQLSRTCVRYEDLFKYNSSIKWTIGLRTNILYNLTIRYNYCLFRVVNFRNSLNDNFTFDDMAYYLTNNIINIVSLNISYVRIPEMKNLNEIILRMGTLKHLTLIETGININDLFFFINRNRSVSYQAHISYISSDYYIVKHVQFFRSLPLTSQVTI